MGFSGRAANADYDLLLRESVIVPLEKGHPVLFDGNKSHEVLAVHGESIAVIAYRAALDAGHHFHVCCGASVSVWFSCGFVFCFVFLRVLFLA